MSFDADDEILQDFLIEAGEIIETLNEELVELEQRPDDTELLNSVFRSFHTIKGGAGFLALDPLVELCHRAEDVFNLLRNGDLQVDAAIMDVMLPVLDSLNDMFDSLRAATQPESAAPALLAAIAAATPEGPPPTTRTSHVSATSIIRSGSLICPLYPAATGDETLSSTASGLLQWLPRSMAPEESTTRLIKFLLFII